MAWALRPDLPQVQFSRARLYRSKGRWDLAIEDLKGALNKLRASPRPARFNWSSGMSTMSWEISPRLATITKQSLRTIHVSNVARAARLNQANIDAESGLNDRARDEYDALISSDHHDTSARLSRALLELRLGQAERSENDLTALLEMGQLIKNPDDVLAARALARLMLGRVQEAFADASEASSLHPNAPTCVCGNEPPWPRAIRLLQLDRPDEVKRLPLGGQRLRIDLRAAAEDLERLARTQKARPSALLWRSSHPCRLGRPERRGRCCEPGGEVSPLFSQSFPHPRPSALLWRRCSRSPVRTSNVA